MNPRRPLLVSPLMRCLVASGTQVAQWQYSNAKLTTAGLTVWEKLLIRLSVTGVLATSNAPCCYTICSNRFSLSRSA